MNIRGMVVGIGRKVDAVGTLAAAGTAVSGRSRVLIGGSVVAGVVAFVAVSPVVVKTALCLSGAMFMSGVVSGFTQGMKELRSESSGVLE